MQKSGSYRKDLSKKFLVRTFKPFMYVHSCMSKSSSKVTMTGEKINYLWQPMRANRSLRTREMV